MRKNNRIKLAYICIASVMGLSSVTFFSGCNATAKEMKKMSFHHGCIVLSKPVIGTRMVPIYETEKTIEWTPDGKVELLDIRTDILGFEEQNYIVGYTEEYRYPMKKKTKGILY